MTLTSFLAGAAFGVALTAPPGPMNAVIAEESALRGWKAGFHAGIGAMTADLLFMFLALVGAVTIIERVPAIQTTMITIGGILMCYFAYDAFKGVRSSFIDEPAEQESRGFSKAFALSLTNPYQIIFWLTIGVGLLQEGQFNMSEYVPVIDTYLPEQMLIVQTGSVALLFGVFAGIFLWVISFPAIVALADDRIDSATPAIAALSGLVLAGFGVTFLLDALTTIV